MAILSIGYDGTVDERQWAKIQASTASVYGVSTPASWKVTAVAGSDRTVAIATGSGWGHHVFDESDTNYTLQGDTVASGSRWDMVVLRRDWGPVGGGPSSFKLIKGSSIKVLPLRANNPGVLDEQPLALVQFSAGQTQPTAIVDLRCWASNGGMEVMDKLTLTYLEVPGADVKLDSSLWRYESKGNGVWGWQEYPLATDTGDQFVGALSTSFSGGWRGFAGGGYSPLAFRREGKHMQIWGAAASSTPEGVASIVVNMPVGMRPATKVPGINCEMNPDGALRTMSSYATNQQPTFFVSYFTA